MVKATMSSISVRPAWRRVCLRCTTALLHYHRSTWQRRRNRFVLRVKEVDLRKAYLSRSLCKALEAHQQQRTGRIHATRSRDSAELDAHIACIIVGLELEVRLLAFGRQRIARQDVDEAQHFRIVADMHRCSEHVLPIYLKE